MGFFQLQRTQFLPATPEQVWDYISAPANLKQITPPHMGFDIITHPLPTGMYAGMIIGYRVKPLTGISVKWLTEITHVSEGSYFVDEQRIGPYSMWHHQHHLKAAEGGVIMSDLVTYEIPFGLLGRLANAWFVRKKLVEIFDYREKVLAEIFQAPVAC